MAGIRRAEYENFCEGPVLHYPVVLRGVTIGYVWCSADLEAHAAGYVVVISALETGSRIDAAVYWEERLVSSCREGLAPVEALERWKRYSEHPEAGGIPEAARIERAPDIDALLRLANPDHEDPLIPEERGGEPQDTMSLAAGGSWDDFAPVTVGKTYRSYTDQPVRYIPVRLGEHLIGYLWASVTDDAADFQPLLPPEVVHNRAHRWWVGEFMRLQESGVSPLRALRSRIGAPEDLRGGRIDADAQERVAASLDELKEIAQR
ncbi:hypothetical protein [Nocardiopsis algeriensis]|uniref:Uncharacterized protein n=1 Tax=Nocardiopsis algeriensis TaxID=1478215 RepID=A0A841IN81_9ACTN|nr:hypothetical protein [Nocardiopsis algeriensis]MBB6119512.1 hypothetical protein [Nocardiopsis algeriensis]